MTGADVQYHDRHGISPTERGKAVGIDDTNITLASSLQAKDAVCPQLGECASDGLDCQPEIVGNIGARHHELKFTCAEMAARHLLNEDGDTFERALADDHELAGVRASKAAQCDAKQADRQHLRAGHGK